MGTITTKTYIRGTFWRHFWADTPQSSLKQDADGIYTELSGAPLDPRDLPDTVKVVITETSREPICPAGYYEDFATANAVTDVIGVRFVGTCYRLVVSAPTRRDAMELYNSIKTGVMTPSMPFPAYEVDQTPALEA
jgi:hypothetical protein